MNDSRLARLALAVAALALAWPLAAEKFEFKYQAGQKYRVISEVKQLFSLTGQAAVRTDQLNRAVVTVTRIEGDKAYHSMEYQNSREMLDPAEPYQYDRQYTADFWRDRLGRYGIDPQFFVPPVRDIPVFPERDLQVGDTWAYQGQEVQDLRSLDIPDPFLYLFPVGYKYAGAAEWQGKTYDLFEIDYQIYYPVKKSWPQAVLHPKLMGGSSAQKMYWDRQAGRAVHYDETYSLMLVFDDGRIATWEGSATAKLEDIVPFDSGAATKDVRRKVDELKLKDVTVREDKEGVTISIENIQFAPDSPELMPSEQAKLDKIAKILAQFPDRPLLITGHTALAGSAEGRQKLSEDRAQAVGQYLLDRKVRTRDSLQYLGKGASEPVGDNGTEAGRARNRRVEITILKE